MLARCGIVGGILSHQGGNSSSSCLVTNTAHEWFPIAAGAFLGLTANLLWTAAGYVAFSYSTEQRRGSFISMQWALLSVGSKCFVFSVDEAFILT